MTTENSKEQMKQKQQNESRAKSVAGSDSNIDKKLDGPNRPST